MWIRHLIQRHRKVIWTIALVVVPLLILGVSALIKHLLVSEEAATFHHAVDMATIALLWGAGA